MNTIKLGLYRAGRVFSVYALHKKRSYVVVDPGDFILVFKRRSGIYWQGLHKGHRVNITDAELEDFMEFIPHD